jgi:hypothetical protein
MFLNESTVPLEFVDFDVKVPRTGEQIFEVTVWGKGHGLKVPSVMKATQFFQNLVMLYIKKTQNLT